MKYLSLFSGIEAASVAWGPLGWKAAGFAEIDPFASAVLNHHYPGVPNLGDVSKIQLEPNSVDVVVGGSPCQSFSVAGKRLGLDDPRGNMALEFVRVVRQSRAKWMVFENVPGLLSSAGGDDFAAFLSVVTGWDVPVPPGGWQNSGCGPARTPDDYGVAWRVLDAQFFGVPQRRRRVFVVGRAGDWRGAAAVLFERHSLSGDTPPSRAARKEIAARTAFGISPDCFDRSGEPTSGLAGDRCGLGVDKELAYALRAKRPGGVASVAGSQTARYGKGTDSDASDPMVVTHTLRAEGFDASEDGTGRGTPLVPIDLRQSSRGGKDTNFRSHGSGGPPGVGVGKPGDPAFTVSERGQAVAGSAVRRLTPLECERLQGFPDGYTAVPYRGKPAADGNRYRALGNSMAVPVMAWIGRRIAAIA